MPTHHQKIAVTISNVFSEKAFSAQGDQKTISQTFWLAGLQKLFQICGTFLDFYFGFLLAFARRSPTLIYPKSLCTSCLYHQMHRLLSTSQRWKNVQILQIYLCYFYLAVLIFWLYTRKWAKSTVLLALYCQHFAWGNHYSTSAKGNVLKALWY